MRNLDLFSGIGGFSLGLERAGIKTAAFCEIDEFCRRVLAKHWPGVPIFGDIRELTREKLIEAGVIDIEAGRTIDLVCGGFPCQPFSCAGKRRGKEDDRYLWPEMFRIIKELRPRWVLGENVAGFVNMGLDDALSDLEAEGYETGAFIIPACAVGAPHRRDRVFIVAYDNAVRRDMWRLKRQGIRRTDEARHEVDSGGQDVAHAEGEQNWRIQQGGLLTDIGASCQDVAHTSRQLLYRGGNARGRRDEPSDGSQRQVESGLGALLNEFPSRLAEHRWPAPCGCEQYEWEPPRVTTGKVPYRKQKLQALGNAVVPAVVEVIGNAIMEYELQLKERK